MLYPFLRPGGMFHAAVEVRGSHEKFGLDAGRDRRRAGRRCASGPAPTTGPRVISHEILGGADRGGDRRGAGAAGRAGGRTSSSRPASSAGRRPPTGRRRSSWATPGRSPTSRPSSSGPTCPAAPRGERPALLARPGLRRGAAPVVERRAARSACTSWCARRDGAVPGELWRRFADAAGVDAGSVDAAGRREPVPSGQRLAGRREIAVLRAVNAALDGRLPQPGYSRSSSGCWPSGCSPATAASARAPEVPVESSPATGDWPAVAPAATRSTATLAELVPRPTPPGRRTPTRWHADSGWPTSTPGRARARPPTSRIPTTSPDGRRGRAARSPTGRVTPGRDDGGRVTTTCA